MYDYRLPRDPLISFHFFASSKSLTGKKPTVRPWTCKRACFYFLLFMIAFMTLVTLLNRLGKWKSSDDPFLDPMANPNIHVADKMIDSN